MQKAHPERDGLFAFRANGSYVVALWGAISFPHNSSRERALPSRNLRRSALLVRDRLFPNGRYCERLERTPLPTELCPGST